MTTRTASTKNAAPGFFSWRNVIWRRTVIVCAVLFAIFLAFVSFLWVKYDHIISERLNGPLFNNSAKIFARPRVVHPGDVYSAAQIAVDLRRAGFSDDAGGLDSSIGSYAITGDTIIIHPGAGSYHNAGQATITTRGGQISTIAMANGQQAASYELEPQLLTALSEGEQRTKRQLLSYGEIPQVAIDAVTSIEDRHFFSHSGVNFFRLAEAILIDLTHRHNKQGGSTLTMQLARGFFLSPERTIKRKAIEILISFELEQKLSKQQIFEAYANYVPMGQRGSFAINGLGEAAHSYFGKDIRNISLAEAATLAGMIQAPSLYQPYRHPDRMIARRNIVLDAMAENDVITKAQAESAKAEPLKLAPPSVESSDAPYFVDLVKDNLSSKYKEQDLNDSAARIYTTIDPDLQRAAADAVDSTIGLVDQQAKARNGKRDAGQQGNPARIPQVALVALDPHTGEVLALIGGRNYGSSQLNHALASRPTGSIFKPFVYAAAFNTGLNPEASTVFTPSTLLTDEAQTFEYDGQEYNPHNFGGEYRGEVPAFFALQMSLNNATVQMAQMIGFDAVASLGRAAGVTNAQATPSVALGAYAATPLQMAGAYTIFANGGVHQDPLLVRSVRSETGAVIDDFHTTSKQVLDPRVAYVMTTMMQNVLNRGTAAGVRARGFSAIAAGKTGTSHDGWFAGYTSNLLCVVWIGYDDYSNLNLEGAHTAAPIWAEFMKKAVALPQYRNTGSFPRPDGVVDVSVDKGTGLIAGATCPGGYSMGYINGTEPNKDCSQHPVDTHALENPTPTGPSDFSNESTTPPAGPKPAPQTRLIAPPQPFLRRGLLEELLALFIARA